MISHSRRRRRHTVAGAVVILGVAVLAQPASAHVDADPATIPAGSTGTVTFTLEHGCEESPTVKLEMQLPGGVGNPRPGAIDGWTSSIAGNVITWTGGPQPSDVALLVPVEMSFPDTPGETLSFPLVQTCEQGEIRWVDPPNPDGSEPEEPAPLVELSESVAPATTAAATTDAPATTAASATTGAAPSTATAAPGTFDTDEGDDNTAAVIGVVAIAIIAVVGVGAWLLAKRTSDTP